MSEMIDLRRRAPWRYRLNIKPFLGDDDDRATFEAAYNGIKAELAKLPPGLHAPDAFDEYAKLAIEREDADIFNLGLDALYDWADEERIWMGVI